MFQKGQSGNPHGRGASVNKVTYQVRTAVANIVNSNLAQFQTDLNSLEPKERCDIMLKLLKFVAPTLSSIALDEAEVKTATEHLQAIANWTHKVQRHSLAEEKEN